MSNCALQRWKRVQRRENHGQQIVRSLLEIRRCSGQRMQVRVHVLDSYQQLKTPTEYVLSSQLPLAFGRGIHFDLQDPKGATICNKLCMTARSWKTLPEAACFIDNVQKKGVKFSEPNLLHDGFATKLSATEAETLKVATQKLCAPKTKAPKG